MNMLKDLCTAIAQIFGDGTKAITDYPAEMKTGVLKHLT